MEGGIVQRLEAQLVAGVGGVGDQCAEEDLRVGIERVGDEVQQLRHLGLEGEGLFLGHGVVRMQRSRPRVAREDFKADDATAALRELFDVSCGAPVYAAATHGYSASP